MEPTIQPEIVPVKRTRTPLIIGVTVLVTAIIAGSAVYLFEKKAITNNNTKLQAQIDTLKTQLASASPTPTASATPIASTKPTATPVPTGVTVSGNVQAYNHDLGLIKPVDQQYNPGVVAKYFQAGTFSSGKQQGYVRIIATQPATDPGGPTVMTFATKDYKSFILDGDPSLTTRYPETDARNPYYFVEKSKISEITPLEMPQQQTLVLDSSFSLYRQVLATSANQKTNEENPVTDFSSYISIPSQFPNLKLYMIPGASSDYLAGDTKVYAVDASGLAYAYNLTNPSNIAVYQSSATDYPSRPNWRLKSAQITTSSSIYNTYDVAFPGGCGRDVDTAISKGISQSDLTKIGTALGIDLYTLKDTGNPIYEAAFKAKMLNDSEYFSTGNPGVTQPTLAQYVAKNPLLFFKDPWGRFDILQEWDYHLMGGCGKPVVYLYPTKTEAVTVNFTTPMQLDVAIPKYDNGWKVLASPNGSLKDLQPKATDCGTLNTTAFGSEYAADACKAGTYPYLYWAGQSYNGSYAMPNQGWIVARQDLSAFMNNTLTQVGLNATEKQDMLSYWLPTMQKNAEPYFRISFRQTADMNRIAPMAVSPKPDTTFRIFLDYVPLANKPATTLQPQTLNVLTRKGFTLVEWGGIKR